MMSKCEKCIHKIACDREVGFGYFFCPYFAEDRHGHWIKSCFEETSFEGGKVIRRKHQISECSECKVEIAGLIDMFYCPNCGAKMDKE